MAKIKFYVNGEPVEDFLDKEEQAEKTDRINQVASEDLKSMQLQRRRRIIRPKYPSQTACSGPVERWSDDKIRREYGIMQKPFNTRVENVLWVIINKGPVNSKQICEELGVNQSAVGDVLSKISRRLPDVIDTNRASTPYTYKVDDNKPDKTLYGEYGLYTLYRRRGRSKGAAELAQARNQADARQPDPNPTPEPEEQEPMGSSELNINVNINVTGSLKVLLGWL